MKLHLFSTLFLLAVCIPAFAQTKSEKDLQQVVREYNALRDMTGKLKPGTITEADIAAIDESVSKNTAILEMISAKESGPVADVARYFRANFIYEKGFILGMKGTQKDAFQIYKTIEQDMARFTSGSFPLEYMLDDKKYVIRWENFAPTQAEYYAGLAEFSYNTKNYDQALPYARKSRENPYISSYLNTLTGYWMVRMKDDRNEQDQELVDVAISTLDAYNLLESDDQTAQGISDIPVQVAKSLQAAMKADPSLSNNGDNWAKAADLLKKAGKNEQYLEFGRAALQAGYKNAGFMSALAEDAISAGDQTTARLAVEQVATNTSDSDCSGLRQVAGLYGQLNEPKRAESFAAKADKCEQQARRQQRNADRDGGLYLGAYIIPLFKLNYGAVASIVNQKTLIEGSYLLINKKKDKLAVFGNNDDAQNWKGYYTHLGIHGITSRDKGTKSYTGALLGYNHREYETIEADVYDDNNAYLGRLTYNPKHTQYILMWNSGGHVNGKIFAADMYFGVGAAYNQFERGGTEGDNFTFENKLLQERKSEYFSFIMRFGLTIGIQLGPKTFR